MANFKGIRKIKASARDAKVRKMFEKIINGEVSSNFVNPEYMDIDIDLVDHETDAICNLLTARTIQVESPSIQTDIQLFVGEFRSILQDDGRVYKAKNTVCEVLDYVGYNIVRSIAKFNGWEKEEENLVVILAVIRHALMSALNVETIYTKGEPKARVAAKQENPVIVENPAEVISLPESLPAATVEPSKFAKTRLATKVDVIQSAASSSTPIEDGPVKEQNLINMVIEDMLAVSSLSNQIADLGGIEKVTKDIIAPQSESYVKLVTQSLSDKAPYSVWRSFANELFSRCVVVIAQAWMDKKMGTKVIESTNTDMSDNQTNSNTTLITTNNSESPDIFTETLPNGKVITLIEDVRFKNDPEFIKRYEEIKSRMSKA